MSISLRLNEEETIVLKKYAELKGVSVSEVIRQSVFERIEDEYDIKAYDKAMREYVKNPVTYSLNEMEKELGLVWAILLNLQSKQKKI